MRGLKFFTSQNYKVHLIEREYRGTREFMGLGIAWNHNFRWFQAKYEITKINKDGEPGRREIWRFNLRALRNLEARVKARHRRIEKQWIKEGRKRRSFDTIYWKKVRLEKGINEIVAGIIELKRERTRVQQWIRGFRPTPTP